MAIPIHYVARNLWVRRVTTALTAGGMALVVFVFAAALMLDAGLKAALVATGAADNVLFIRKGAETEIQSAIERGDAALIDTYPQVARGAQGDALVSREIVVLDSLPKRASGKRSNVPIRGVSPMGLQLRPQVRVVQGRMFQPGSNEIVVGAAVERQFAGVGLGEALGFAQRRWTVVGIFDGGRSAFDSEIWGDAEQLQQAFRRTSWSSVIARLASHDGLRALQAALSADPRLQVEVQRERQFYQDEARGLATFINVLGLALAVIFSLGATIGAAITMYASVANRTAEIGTLRALGFGRRAILGAFLIEALLLALVGGVAGLAGAALLQGLSISATNFQSFSELAFGFAMTPRIVVDGLLFALVMGLVGGVLPAIKAARLKIVDALRAA